MINITRISNQLIFSSVCFWLISCNTGSYINNQKGLNIIWLVAEDLGAYIPSFGDSTINTPNLDRLADEGVRYTNVYSVSGVCSPSRAALVTGMYPSSIGAHHMRTLFQQPAAKKKGLINYEVVPPPEVKMVSQILRENGYYCTNNQKEDYQFYKSEMAWDESSIFAHWRNRPKGMNFFSVFNFGVTHESNLWNPWYRHFDLDPFPPERSQEKEWWKQFEGIDKPLYISGDINIKIPPYLPNNDIVKEDIKRMYSNIAEMDGKIGLILDQLEKDGLLENTIVVWYTDHGGPLPRQKRLLYDSGIRVPMIIRYPGKKGSGHSDDRLISFVDFAPTLLSLLNIEPSSYYQGAAFEGEYRSSDERLYIHAAADRFDEHYDMIRAVRDKRYKYLKNYNPDKPYYLPLEYRERMNTMKELLRLNERGELNDAQSQWFRLSKPEEELFDLENDPHELNNLSDNILYKNKMNELRNECRRWMGEINDMGFIPEGELINSFWPDKIQPITATPKVYNDNGTIKIDCITDGASIGYKLSDDNFPWIGWRPYTVPFDLGSEKMLRIIAHRLGYQPSDTLIYIPEKPF
ncbi:MAG: sulfatase [Candidatus Marinimicrobia bacterium]|nr:sulfatase [Candidatus Neomarinimicrobiota bacterium]